jgi:hypothetical protein
MFHREWMVVFHSANTCAASERTFRRAPEASSIPYPRRENPSGYKYRWTQGTGDQELVAIPIGLQFRNEFMV